MKKRNWVVSGQYITDSVSYYYELLIYMVVKQLLVVKIGFYCL